MMGTSKDDENNNEDSSEKPHDLPCQRKEQSRTTSGSNNRKACCPVCRQSVKYPSRLSYLGHNQRKSETELLRRRTATAAAAAVETPEEKAAETTNNKSSSITTAQKEQQTKTSKKELYVSRKYLDRFLQSPAYGTLCQVEYHGVNNLGKIRKEITESYAILDSIHRCCEELNNTDNIPTTSRTSSPATTTTTLDNVFLIDLCSGKSLTTAICGALYPNGKFLAIDKLPPALVPHFIGPNTEYLSCDINTAKFLKDLQQTVERTVEMEPHREVFLVGMHLCGNLSIRAIELFHRIPQIRGLILSPCCLPSLKRFGAKMNMKSSQQPFDDCPGDESKVSGSNNDGGGRTTPYQQWCHHLIEIIQTGTTSTTISTPADVVVPSPRTSPSEPTVPTVKWYCDDDMHSMKNCIIRTVR